ncbi:AAA family ATPase [Polynucleobacter sp. UB-Siik-W21]|uniref:AAA family ATPase n=1 Tax=Polynucleobacter sp. UB-Siik-W21 TaxID=1855646 RepID=UPI001BFD0385|nr:AAA family ATPase [Polynucleobacter sp. UB-Siik-W21]
MLPNPNDYLTIPTGLQKERNFIFWKLVWDDRKGKFKKKPVNPQTLCFGGQNDPDCFIGFSQASLALEKESKKLLEDRKFHGIGLAFSGNDLIGLDLDHVYDQAGKLKPFAAQILNNTQGFVEKSVSGNGYHIITRTDLNYQNFKDKQTGFEIFRSDMFIALTGKEDKEFSASIFPTSCVDLSVIRSYAEKAEREHQIRMDRFEIDSLRDPNLSIEELRDIVMSIKAPDTGRDFWLRIGMAIHHQGKGHEEYKDIWDDYSLQNPDIVGEYAGSNVIDAEWRSFNREPSRVVTHATLRYYAKKYPKSIEIADEEFPELDYSTEDTEATEFVIDGFIAEGMFMFAGSAGVGKTTLLVPLAAAAAHLCAPDYELKPALRRKVIYLTEDAKQVRRILYGLRLHYGVNLSDAEFKEWFKIIETRRSSPESIAALIRRLAKKHTVRQQCVDGLFIDVGPLVVPDTVAATFDLEDENNNSQVSKFVAHIKVACIETNTSLWAIAHLAKGTNKADIEKATPRGASAFEGDVNGTGYIFNEGVADARYMMLGKTRYSPEFRELVFSSSLHSMQVQNRLGQTINEPYRVGIAHKSSKEERIGQKLQVKSTVLEQEVIRAIQSSPESWATRTYLKESLEYKSGPKANQLKAVIDLLVAQKRIEVKLVTPSMRSEYGLPNATTHVLKVVQSAAADFQVFPQESSVVTTP